MRRSAFAIRHSHFKKFRRQRCFIFRAKIDPLQQNKFHLQATLHGNILCQQINIFAIFSAVVSSSIIIFNFLPLMVPVLFAISVLAFIPTRFFSKKEYKWRKAHTSGSRKSEEIKNWLSTPSTIKEISLLGASQYFQNRFFINIRLYFFINFRL